jgi:poly(A) polymerase
MPNKKRRSVFLIYPKRLPHLLARFKFRSSNSTSDALATTPLQTTENGVAVIQPLSINPAAQPLGIYPPSVKDPADIKSPQLPFGENVAVATGVVGAQ